MHIVKACMSCGRPFSVWLRSRGPGGKLLPSRAMTIHRIDPEGKFHSLDCAARYGVVMAYLKSDK